MEQKLVAKEVVDLQEFAASIYVQDLMIRGTYITFSKYVQYI